MKGINAKIRHDVNTKANFWTGKNFQATHCDTFLETKIITSKNTTNLNSKMYLNLGTG